MTQTASRNRTLRQCVAIFKWELRNCKMPLLIFGIITAVGITFCMMVCLSAGVQEITDRASVLGGVRAFQISASYVVAILTAVFTFICSIRTYAYLHDKRKADMYGSLPVSRRVFFAAKTASAAIISLVPSLLVLSLIALFSIAFGQPLVNEVSMLFLYLPVGSLACLAFYGLLAVCCGTTPNTVLSFIFICAAYSVAAAFVRGTLMSFVQGLPMVIYSDSFVMKALNPMMAYSGSSLIYWVLFIAACFIVSVLLMKKRRAECAQTSFAYMLPAYLVKLLIAFNVGMFLGCIFGSLSVLAVPYFGFAFGFVIGSTAAYAVTHIILYRGTDKIFKTAIPLAALVLMVCVGMAVIDFDYWGYTGYVPDAASVKSAGLVDLADCYCAGSDSVLSIGRSAADDFDDEESIRAVTSYHRSEINLDKDESRYGKVWLNIFVGSFVPQGVYERNGYVIAYKLNNGFTVVRYYDSVFRFGSTDTKSRDLILDSETYFRNYSSVMNVAPAYIDALTLNRMRSSEEDLRYLHGDDLMLKESENVDEAKRRDDIRRLIEAYRRDFDAHGKTGKAVYDINVSYKKQSSNYALPDIFFDMISYAGKDGDSGVIYSSYTETLQVLRDIGALTKDNEPNTQSPYYYENQLQAD
ncbi:MAG: hypothetical protein IJ598_00255 [Ruminococcus sp.]|nr:hypothetical protein [Ruminococcus sp.]